MLRQLMRQPGAGTRVNQFWMLYMQSMLGSTMPFVNAIACTLATLGSWGDTMPIQGNQTCQPDTPAMYKCTTKQCHATLAKVNVSSPNLRHATSQETEVENKARNVQKFRAVQSEHPNPLPPPNPPPNALHSQGMLNTTSCNEDKVGTAMGQEPVTV